jgi:uncharacterized protein (DUF433 family)
MGGRPCIRGIRITVATIAGLVASGHSQQRILDLYPYLDIDEALAYVATNRNPPRSGLGG